MTHEGRRALVFAVWLLLGALGLSLAPGAAADEKAWARYMEHGARALQQGRYVSAEGWFLDAVREAEAIDPRGSRLAQSLRGLAEAYRKQGNQRQADAVLRRAAALEGSAPPAPSGLSQGLDVLAALANYAELLREIGRETESAMVEMRIQRLREVRAGEAAGKLLHFNPVAELRDYAELLRQRNRDAEARAVGALATAEAQRLIDYYQKLTPSGALGVTDPHFAWPMQISAGMEALKGRLYPEAHALFEAAVKSAERFGPEDVRLAFSLSAVAYTHMAQRNDAVADRAVQEALRILEKPASVGHNFLPRSLEVLALAHLRFRFRPDRALAHFDRTLPLAERVLVKDHPLVGLHLTGLAAAHVGLAQSEKAKTPLERALRIAEQQYQREHLALAGGLQRVADLYIEQGNYAQADAILRRVLAVAQRMLDPDHPDVLRARQSYAVVARQMGRQARGVASLAASTTVPIQVMRNLTLVEVTFNRSYRSLMMVDTGASATLVTPLVLTRLGLAVPAQATREKMYGVGDQPIEVPFVTVASVQVGEATVENLAVGVYDAFAGGDVEGLLGGDFLQRFRVTLDKRARRMTLEPLPR